MRVVKSLAVAISAAALACAPASDGGMTMDSTAMAANEAAARQAIESTNAAAGAALNAGDVAGWSNAYAEDAIVMWPNGPASRGRAEREATVKAMLGTASVSNVKFTTEDLTVMGDMAIEAGTYAMTVTPKGGPATEDKGKYMTMWKKQADGSWKIARDINNSDLPPPKG